MTQMKVKVFAMKIKKKVKVCFQCASLAKANVVANAAKSIVSQQLGIEFLDIQIHNALQGGFAANNILFLLHI